MLIATVLSQRTRDQNTYSAATRLFSRYSAPGDLAGAPVNEIEKLIKPAGFPAAKARAVKEISRLVHDDFDDRVPDDMETLLKLPMVGRKTANCVLAYAFGRDAICVDTHVHRIANRVGLVSTRNPDQTETALREVIPRRRWRDINSLMVVFGQEICRPRGPRCKECPINCYCDYYAPIGTSKA